MPFDYKNHMSKNKRWFWVRVTSDFSRRRQVRALKEAGATDAEILTHGEGGVPHIAFVIENMSVKGDTICVADMTRLAPKRDLLHAALSMMADKGVALAECELGRSIPAHHLYAVIAGVEGAAGLASGAHKYDAASGNRAAQVRWGARDRTPIAKAKAIWHNLKYRTAKDALAHPDMAGWTRADCYSAKYRKHFGPRGTQLRSKT